MPEPMNITFASELTIAEGRTIAGIAVPFGSVSRPVMFGGKARRHRFERGAFTRTISERGTKVRLFAEHDRGRFPIGKAATLAEVAGGLRVAFTVADTSDGNDALALVRDGFVSAFSVGVTPIGVREDGDVLVHTEARLDEVSLVSEPAFEDAVAAAFGADSIIGLPVAIARRRLSLLEKDFRR